LYDDDERAHTEEIVNCKASKKGNTITLNLSASTKTHIAKFNKTSRPKHVSLNGKEVPHIASPEGLARVELGWTFDPSLTIRAKWNASGSASELVLHF
jgi:hypothetical protein